MVDKRPTRRKRRAPPKNASGKKVPPKSARTPEEEQPLTLGTLMHIPDFRQRVIGQVAQKLV